MRTISQNNLGDMCCYKEGAKLLKILHGKLISNKNETISTTYMMHMIIYKFQTQNSKFQCCSIEQK